MGNQPNDRRRRSERVCAWCVCAEGAFCPVRKILNRRCRALRDGRECIKPNAMSIGRRARGRIRETWIRSSWSIWCLRREQSSRLSLLTSICELRAGLCVVVTDYLSPYAFFVFSSLRRLSWAVLLYFFPSTFPRPQPRPRPALLRRMRQAPRVRRSPPVPLEIKSPQTAVSRAQAARVHTGRGGPRCGARASYGDADCSCAGKGERGG